MFSYLDRRLSIIVLTLVALFTGATARADLFVVNSAGDDTDIAPLDGCFTGNLILGSGGFMVRECTLRAALRQSERTPDRDQIEFSDSLLFGGASTVTLNPGSNYPILDNPVDIDATTAPGWSATGFPRVRIRGTGIFGFSGLQFRTGADGSTVQGIAFQDLTYGVHLDGADEVWIDSCSFGYFQTPPPFIAESLAPNTTGIRVESTSELTKIGVRVTSGLPPMGGLVFSGHGNLISGNTFGIVNEGESTQIVGNKIGTNLSGESTTTSFMIPAESIGNVWGIWAGNTSSLKIGQVITPLFSVPQARGNVISGNDYGIYVNETVDHGGLPLSIVGNHIGTDDDGEEDLGNTNYGIYIENSFGDVSIGGGIAGRNVIAGNGSHGIHIGYATISEVEIANNLIGVGEDEITPFANDDNGIWAESGAPLLIRNNVIGGNGLSGVLIDGVWFAGIGDVTIEDNRIGVNNTGETIPNALNGITIEHDGTPSVTITENTIGGNDRGIVLGEESENVTVTSNYLGTNADGDDLGNTLAGLRSTSLTGGHQIGGIGLGNTVGWNGANGLSINNGLEQTLVVGNFIGVDQQDNPMPNDHSGIRILEGAGAAQPVVVGSLLSDSPDDHADRENRIAFNGRDGVELHDFSWATIRANRISENNHLPIDLGANGPTANDPGDTDNGANQLQNSPVIDPSSDYDLRTGEFTLEYRVESFTANSRYDLRVDVYVTDESGTEPEQIIWEDAYPFAEAAQQRTIQFFPTEPIPLNSSLVLTATDDAGRTSEVSLPIVIPEPGFTTALAVGGFGLAACGAGRRKRSVRA